MQDFVSNDDTLRAEVIWTLKMNMSHYSYKSAEDSGSLFQAMFKDSAIAAKFSCGERKANYIMRFGLATHFQKVQLESLHDAPAYVLLFDESYNPVTKDKQMDVHVRYWSSDCHIATHYMTSVFMGHGRADDLMEHFLVATEKLNMAKVVQVSMDGPNVNWSFHDKLQKKLKLDFNAQLLDVGSCGLHIVHGAFKHGAEASKWEIASVMQSVYSLFNETPARREDYTRITDSNVFGRNFCNTRWLENVPVAERVLEMWDCLQTYTMAAVKGPVALPTTKAFKCVRQAVEDPLTPVKLHAFVSIAKIVQPFLTVYQTDRPMMPFIASDLHKLLKLLLGRFLKASVIEDMTLAKLIDVDMKERLVY